MAKLPTDERIGFRNEEGKIVKNPTEFSTVTRYWDKLRKEDVVSRKYWNKKENPNVTKVFFGENKQYFYILPPYSGNLDPEIRKELEELVKSYNAVEQVAVETPAPVKKKVAEKVKEDTLEDNVQNIEDNNEEN